MLSVRHRLPGRLRLQLVGLKSGRLSRVPFCELLQRHHAITSVQANPLTGSLLILYRPAEIGEAELIAHVSEVVASSIAPGSAPAKATRTLARTSPDLRAPVKADHTRDVLRLTGAALILGAISLKRFLSGDSPLSKSPQLLNLAAIVSVLAGYPILRRGLKGASRGQVLNTDLLLAAASFSLMLLRESMPGLIILVLTEAVNVAEKMALAKAKANYLGQAEEQDVDLRPASLPAADAEQLTGSDREHHQADPGVGWRCLFLAARPRPGPGHAGGWRTGRGQAGRVHRVIDWSAPCQRERLPARRRTAPAGHAVPGYGRLVRGPDLLSGARGQGFSFLSTRTTRSERLLGLAAAAYREVTHPLGAALWRQVQERGIQATPGAACRIAGRLGGEGR